MPGNLPNPRPVVGRHLILCILCALCALCAPALAETVVIDDAGYREAFGNYPSSSANYLQSAKALDTLVFDNIHNCKEMRALRAVGVESTSPSSDAFHLFPDGPQSFPVEYRIGEVTVGYGRYGTFKVGDTGTIWMSFESWDVSAYTGSKSVKIVKLDDAGIFPTVYRVVGSSGATAGSWTPDTSHKVWFDMSPSPMAPLLDYEVYYSDTFKNTYTIDIDEDWAELSLIRNIDGRVFASSLYVSTPVQTYSTGTIQQTNDVQIKYIEGTPIDVGIKSASGKWYNRTFVHDIGDPGETPTLRTGTVTMTDHNGTTISGFDVRAVNYYTGEEYTVSTDSDVAVITLPMDRLIEIRNPQTGEYEEAPVGYYRFYGQSPGYKMLNEEGIKISVMPEKYGSYQLCDILVTSDTGYLTGKHLFQIRSRSDNSILQTGTISAKSATTGEWYNTTVIDGIATLILPYDTSNSISQYAGNYYVYATSPGYEENDYGTQITVMPQTVSEIKSILLTPIGGVPTPGNVTLRIQAFSETGPGIPNAEIFIAGVLGAGKDVWNTYTASSTGYLEVSVPGNSTYDIVASGAGYYDSARRIEVFTEPPPLIEIKLYLSGAPTVEPTTQPTGWVTTQPTTQPTGGIPDDDDGSDSFLIQAVRGIGQAFGVGFATAKLLFGALLALSIGFATAKQLRGGAAEFGLGLLGGTLLGVLVGLLPVWIIVVLLLVVGLYIGHRYVGGGNNG